VEEGGKITGSIRVTQFFLSHLGKHWLGRRLHDHGKMRDGNSDRTVKYEGKLVGEELHLSTRRRPEDKPTESVAHRAPDGEGAMPAKLLCPRFTKFRSTASQKRRRWLEQLEPIQGPRQRRTRTRVADAIASNGMKDCRYVTSILTTPGKAKRATRRNITSNKKFPDMKPWPIMCTARG